MIPPDTYPEPCPYCGATIHDRPAVTAVDRVARAISRSEWGQPTKTSIWQHDWMTWEGCGQGQRARDEYRDYAGLAIDEVAVLLWEDSPDGHELRKKCGLTARLVSQQLCTSEAVVHLSGERTIKEGGKS